MASSSLLTVLVVLFSALFATASALPSSPPAAARDVAVFKRTDPSFPSDIPSCVKCQPEYDSISSCAAAAPVLANFTTILFNPGAFIDVIKCACTDTFQAAYPQCADCFERTNQTALLNNPDLSSTLNGLRTVCGSTSVTVSNVTKSNGEPVASVPASAASVRLGLGAPTALLGLAVGGILFGVAILL